MTDNLKKFLEEVSKDAGLANKINTASKETIISIAKEKGIELTEEDFAIPANQELSDDDLDAVAGGDWCPCVIGGNGGEGGDGLACGCALLGGGGCCDDSHCTGHGNGACACALAGYGVTDGRQCNEGTSSKFA